MTDKFHEALEDMTWQFAYRSHDAKRKWLTTGGLSALESAFAALGWDDPHYVEECGCEHPGCTAWATCGTVRRSLSHAARREAVPASLWGINDLVPLHRNPRPRAHGEKSAWVSPMSHARLLARGP